MATVYAQAEIQQQDIPSRLGEKFSKCHFYWDPCLHALNITYISGFE